jgi:signal transduction histidine kinase/streptogramin lyase
VNDVAEDADGAVWVATNDGAARLVPGADRFERFSRIARLTNTVLPDADGSVWIGARGGLARLDPATGRAAAFVHDPDDPTSLQGGYVVALCRDRSGVLWIGSYQSGVDRLVFDEPRFPRFGRQLTGPRGAAHRDVRGFAEDAAGTLWIATRGGLSARAADGTVRTWARTRDDLDAYPGWGTNAVLVDHDDNVWLGTSEGLARYDRKGDRFDVWRADPEREGALPSGDVTALLEDRGGALWVGTAAGLCRFDPERGVFEPFGPVPERPGDPGRRVLSLYEDGKGRIWYGTYAGVVRLGTDRSAWDRFRLDPTDPTSLGSNYVWAFHETTDGTFWLGTAGGLDRFDEAGGTFTHFDRRAGLPNPVVCGILEDGAGRLWLSTQRGLARFDPAEGRCTTYDVRDGLQSNLFREGAALRRRDGTLLFGGIEGYNAFDPARLDPAAGAPPPPVVVTRFRTGGAEPGAWRDLAPGEAVTLDHRTAFFTIEYAALDYRRPWRNRYRYRLEGLDDGWVDAGARASAAYTSVPPGRYVFRVQGSAGDGAWSPNEATVALTVTPPFWRTRAFLLAAAAVLVAGLLVAHRLRVRARVARTLEIERARAAEREEVRRRTADDFHDELGHRLTKIGLFSEVVRRQLGRVSPEVDGWLAKIVNESKHLSDDARDFVWSLGPGGDTLHDLAEYLARFGEELFDRTDVEFRTEGITEDLRRVELTMESRRHIGSIFKEAMNNALRHSGGTRVRLGVRLDAREFEIFLADDGRGYARTSVRAGNGLKNMELRARKIDGTIRIASRPGAGSTISLTRSAAWGSLPDDQGLPRRG